MNGNSNFALTLSLIGLATAVRSEPAPDPTDFMANLTAFAESCGSRFPEFSDTSVLLLASMEPDDRKLYEDTRRAPGFDAALVKARAQVANAAAESLHDACKLMHDGLKKK